MICSGIELKIAITFNSLTFEQLKTIAVRGELGNLHTYMYLITYMYKFVLKEILPFFLF